MQRYNFLLFFSYTVSSKKIGYPQIWVSRVPIFTGKKTGAPHTAGTRSASRKRKKYIIKRKDGGRQAKGKEDRKEPGQDRWGVQQPRKNSYPPLPYLWRARGLVIRSDIPNERRDVVTGLQSRGAGDEAAKLHEGSASAVE